MNTTPPEHCALLNTMAPDHYALGALCSRSTVPPEHCAPLAPPGPRVRLSRHCEGASHLALAGDVAAAPCRVAMVCAAPLCFARSCLSAGLFCKFSPGGGGFATLGIPKAPNCLTHTRTCKPLPHSEADSLANQMATESRIGSQHVKASAVPNTRPKSMDPQNAVPLASARPCHP